MADFHRQLNRREFTLWISLPEKWSEGCHMLTVFHRNLKGKERTRKIVLKIVPEKNPIFTSSCKTGTKLCCVVHP